MTEMNEWYWTYRAPKPEPQAPAELSWSSDDWNSLSPGMRREITRQYEPALPPTETKTRRQLKDRKAEVERAGRQRL